jgi:1-deoxy-D-xylulose-5-phosphate synthase
LALAQINNPEHFAHYDFAFVKPLDEGLLHNIFNEFQKVITIEDGVITGGFGSAILEFSAKNNYTSNIKILGIPDGFIDQGTIDELQQFCKIDVHGLLKILSSY